MNLNELEKIGKPQHYGRDVLCENDLTAIIAHWQALIDVAKALEGILASRRKVMCGDLIEDLRMGMVRKDVLEQGNAALKRLEEV